MAGMPTTLTLGVPAIPTTGVPRNVTLGEPTSVTAGVPERVTLGVPAMVTAGKLATLTEGVFSMLTLLVPTCVVGTGLEAVFSTSTCVTLLAWARAPAVQANIAATNTNALRLPRVFIAFPLGADTDPDPGRAIVVPRRAQENHRESARRVNRRLTRCQPLVDAPTGK